MIDKVRFWLIRIIFEFRILIYRIDDGGLVVVGRMEVKLMDVGVKYNGCVIGIGGFFFGCFFWKIWIGVWLKLVIWFLIVDICSLFFIFFMLMVFLYVR